MATATATKKWSPYQESLFAFAKAKDNGDVRAVAGSGKTTSIEEFAKRLPSSTKGQYLVFNKRNRDEADQRMPPNIKASTFHSAGLSALRSKYPKTQIRENKLWEIMEILVEDGLSERDVKIYGGRIRKLVGIGRGSGIGALYDANEQNWKNLLRYHDMRFDPEDGDKRTVDDLENWAVRVANTLLRESNDCVDNWIDFDDMVYAPILTKARFWRQDIVCVDEAQDTNPIQQAILHEMVGSSGRLIAVGDPRQAIYGWRGADARAMDNIARDFRSVRFPLSVNYRCSRAVIQYAREFCPEIEAWDNAPEGSVNTLINLKLDDVQLTDAILCRTNAPLVGLAIQMLASGIPCTILGSDFGADLAEYIKKASRKDTSMAINEFVPRLEELRDREIEFYKARKQDARIQSVADKVDSIYAVVKAMITEGGTTVQDLINFIDRVFSDKERGVTLSTVHKAKGLEWDNVYILNRWTGMPSKAAKVPWQIEQENNLIYVAYTRARHNLNFIEAEAIQAA